MTERGLRHARLGNRLLKEEVDAIEVDVAAIDGRVTVNETDIDNIETKTDNITVTQEVNLDQIDDDVAVNNDKNSYPPEDETKVGYLNVTGSVDLDTMETDVTANNAKVTYPSGDSTKVGYLTVTDDSDVDSMRDNMVSARGFFSISDTTVAKVEGYNFASVSRESAGKYRVNFTDSLQTAYYATSISMIETSTNQVRLEKITNQTTSYFEFTVHDGTSNTDNAEAATFIVFGTPSTIE